MLDCALIRTSWRDPAGVLSAHADDPMTLCLLSGGEGERARWSYLARDPESVWIVTPEDRSDPFSLLDERLGDPAPALPDGPPFQGGIAGLCAYELGARAEGVPLARRRGFPDAIFGRYLAVLAFDHLHREVLAVGRGETSDAARQSAERALSWLSAPARAVTAGPLAESFGSTDGDRYEASVVDVVARIAAGEIFQANIARIWSGRLSPGVRPFDLVSRLVKTSPAPFASYLRLEGMAVVSNSPERFLKVADGVVESRPIKGTAPRGGDATSDAALAAHLAASPKDRAENLMIVDLMRNDVSRISRPGEVTAPELFSIESFANVHHLVSSVRGRLNQGVGPGKVLAATFPPGSITGAPKVQAMKVIEAVEPPRGPFFGSMFWAGFDGAMDASVLIRTVLFVAAGTGWTLEARAGGGIVADSEPLAERAETEAKIGAIRRALTEVHP
jgi:para-aminobenzoate synthetase component I